MNEGEIRSVASVESNSVAMRLPSIPASFFSMVLGIAGLGGAWRQATRLWHLPSAVGELLMVVAFVVWAVLLGLYVVKLLWRHGEALEEARHPIQCCFIGMIGVSTMLIGNAALPYSRIAAILLFAFGAAETFGFAVWRTGILWQGGRDPASTTAVLYLPVVGGSFVTATVLANLGLRDWAQLAFGAGLFSWLAIESVLLTRLYTAPALPPALRPTLGIQLAPPTVGLVAYLAVTEGPLSLPAYALFGYALLQVALLMRLLPWIRQQPFAPTYWGFTFGLSAIATAPLVMVLRGDSGPAAVLAPYLFVGSNALIALISAATIALLLRGKLVVRPVPSTAK